MPEILTATKIEENSRNWKPPPETIKGINRLQAAIFTPLIEKAMIAVRCPVFTKAIKSIEARKRAK